MVFLGNVEGKPRLTMRLTDFQLGNTSPPLLFIHDKLYQRWVIDFSASFAISLWGASTKGPSDQPNWNHNRQRVDSHKGQCNGTLWIDIPVECNHVDIAEPDSIQNRTSR